MIATGDIVQVKLFHVMLGQAVDNVLHFRALRDIAGGSDLDALAGAVGTDWFASLKANVAPDLVFDHVELDSPDSDDISRFDYDPGSIGTHTGDCLAPEITVSCQLVRQSKITRHGYKRFSGLVETDVTKGTLTSGVRDAWTDFLTQWFMNDYVADLGSGSVSHMKPIIWGKPSLDPVRSSRQNLIIGVHVNPNTGTANSRKRDQAG